MRIQIVALSLVAALGSAAFAADRRVGAGQTYAKIQEAVDAAQPGDRIVVARGTYAENVSVRKDKLQFVAAKGVVWDGTVGAASGVCLDVRASAVLVQGFAFRGGMHHVMSAGPDMRIVKCTSSGAEGQGFTIWGTHGTVESCTVTGAGSLGIYVEGDDATVRANRVSGVLGFGVYAWGARATVDRNVVRNTDGTQIVMLSDAAKATRNDCSVSSTLGIQVTGLDAVVQSNRVSYAGTVGILMESSGGSLIGNTVSHTKYSGVRARGDRIVVSRNRVEMTGDLLAAILVTSLTSEGGGVVEGNQASDAQSYGFMAETKGVTLRDNTALRCGTGNESGFLVYGNSNSLSGNKAQDGGGAGYVVWGDENKLSKCSATLNVRNGFLIYSGANNEVTACTASANDGDGLQNLASATDVVGGTFSGNRIDVTNAGTFDVYKGVKAATGGTTTQPEL